MEENKCWLYDNCNHIDCNRFCLRKFKLSKLYDSALVPENLRKVIRLRYDSNGTDMNEFKMLKSFTDNIEDFVKNGNNLYIYSTRCGNGKTSWAIKMIQAYLDRIWHKSPLEPARALFISVPRYLLALKENISEKSQYVRHIKDNVLTADIVVWDEVGSKGLTEFEHENILSLINCRVNDGKTNIYTSNLSKEELHNAVGDRLYSRIINNSIKVELNGLDKRGIK